MSDSIPIPKTAQEINETLADGAMIQVEFRPLPDIVQAPEWIKVRKVPRNGMHQYFSAVNESIQNDNEEPEAAFFLDRPVEFVQSLSEESFDSVMMKGRQLNFTRLLSWTERKMQVLGMAKGNSRAIEDIMAPMIARLSRNSTSS